MAMKFGVKVPFVVTKLGNVCGVSMVKVKVTLLEIKKVSAY